MDDRELQARWAAHPLFPVLPVLRDLLSGATNESAHMLVISDARGVLMWIDGHRRVIAATEDMHFVCGADWSEAGAGTNALGTAIAVDHPVQIFSAEHFNRAVHPWQCSGAPIHHPETGEILGVLDSLATCAPPTPTPSDSSQRRRGWPRPISDTSSSDGTNTSGRRTLSGSPESLRRRLW